MIFLNSDIFKVVNKMNGKGSIILRARMVEAGKIYESTNSYQHNKILCLKTEQKTKLGITWIFLNGPFVGEIHKYYYLPDTILACKIYET